MVDKHQAARLDTYLATHTDAMRRFLRGAFVVEDGVTLDVPSDQYAVLSGVLECVGGVRIEVSKLLDVTVREGEIYLRTVWYRYHVQVAGRWPAFRYDWPHPHRPEHHCHRFDWSETPPAESIETVSSTDWPTLSQVIEETEQWYYDHLLALERPA